MAITKAYVHISIQINESSINSNGNALGHDLDFNGGLSGCNNKPVSVVIVLDRCFRLFLAEQDARM